MGNLPDCFCNSEALSACDWTVEVSVKYHRPGDPAAPVSEVPWSLTNIPQPLAQVILQSMVAAVNKNGLDVYVAWAEGCGQGEIGAKVRQAANL